MKVTVLGAAGGIGQPLSLLLKNQLPAGTELALNDIAPVTPGVAVDLSHIPTAVKVVGYGQDGLEKALEGASIVLIPAGVPRKPGMDRADLFNINAGIVRSLAEAVSRFCPQAFVGVITNPVNTTVPIVAEVFKREGTYNPKRLFGVTTLDVIRSETFVGQLKNIDPTELSIKVIGGHSGKTILPLLSRVEGVSLGAEEIASLTTRIQNAGTEVVEAKAGGGSATLSMAAAAARFCNSLVKAIRGEPGIVECAYVEDNTHGTGFFAGPIQLGPDGVAEIVALGGLSEYEQSLMNEVVDILTADVEKGVDFVSGS